MTPGPIVRHTATPTPHRPSSARAASAVGILLRGSALGLLLLGTIAFGLLKVVEPEGAGPHTEHKRDQAPLPRPVRVLLGTNLKRIRVQAPSGVTVTDSSGAMAARKAPGAWVECISRSSQIVAGDHPTSAPVTVQAGDSSAVVVAFYRNGGWSEPLTYPGRLRLMDPSDDGFTVINDVDVEPYVACVTANEIWPGFHEQAIRAQAIVARTYVLYQMKRRNNALFDVSATQGSQVYRGVRRDSTGVNARRAAEYTSGLVLTWFDGDQNQVFCTYYSAACGGMTQSAGIFGVESDIPPLAGGVKCDYCRIAPGETYRWGPVRMPLDEVFDLLAARFPELRKLEALNSVSVGETTPDGRAVTVRVTGVTGAREELLAERFRLALGAGVIRSTHFRLARAGRSLVFEGGQGFGHGLGMCQWGAEGQARQGKRTGAILRYYYPDATPTRAY